MKLPYFEYHFDHDLSLPDRLLTWSERETPALACKDRTISYGELNAIMDTLAFRLSERGLKKGDVVAVDMGRSERYICAVYGVMRAGGCCLPMEHTWPEARKQAVLEASGAILCIDESQYAAMLSEGYRTPEQRVVCETGDNALLLFTSGSTGAPKGIYMTYGRLNNIHNTAQGRHAMYPWLYDIKKFPSFVTFSALFGLTACTTLHSLEQLSRVLTEEESASPHSVGQAILEYGLEQLICMPDFVRAGLQDETFCAALLQLKDIQISGGALTQSLVDQLRAVAPDLPIRSNYGMTEIGVITTGYVTDDVRSVGRPAPNTLVAVLDENGQDVGVNEPGEICVGTKKITDAYMNNPELNRQKHFVHPEYGPLFRTGDLGMGDEAGNLRYLGRMDRMVKIRGVRIELDEIEQTISTFPGVKRGLAAVHGTDDDRFVVGYYQSEAPLDERNLRSHIFHTLPQSYMPRFLMRIEQIPMTETGKVAYPKLPLPEVGEGIAYEAPETEQERCLSRVLADVLNLPPEKISMDAGFAQLGGDSIRSMIASSRLREQGWLIQPNTLYNAPTLQQAAGQLKPVSEPGGGHRGCVARGIPEADVQRIVQAVGGEDKVEAILNMSFESRSIYERLRQKGAEPSSIAALIPVDRGMDEARFYQRVQALVSCHPALRSEIVETELGAAYQVVHKKKAPSCYYRDLRYLADGTELPNEKQRAFCTMYMNFYTATPRSSREALTPHFVCFRFGEERSAVGCSCSHAFLDGWSTGILMQELAAAEDPAAVDNYIDYSTFHSSKSKSEDLRFWRAYLRGVEIGKQILPMQAQWEDGVVQSRRITLDEGLSRRLEQYGKEKHLSPTILLQWLTGRIICEVLDRSEIVMKVFFAARGANVPREDAIIGNLSRLFPIRYRVGQSPAEFHADLRLAEHHMAPTIGEIFAAAGLWVRPVLLTFTTNDLPGSEKLRKDKLFLSPSTNISADTLDAAVICTPGSFGAQFVYNPLIFPEEKMGHAESRLRELAQQLLQEV